jgi:hypothetical protein
MRAPRRPSWSTRSPATSISKRVAIYLRVSTDQQTTENQRLELERVAEQRGWQVVATYEDAGVSGAKGREKRPGFDEMSKDLACLMTSKKLGVMWSSGRVL